MSGKFKKRDIERKGSEKAHEKDMMLIDRNANDLAHPERLNEEFEKESEPGVAGVESRLKKREGI